jgi:hypothetical protein
MGRTIAFLILLLATGCVERRMTIVSDPPGARVTVNNQELGAAPVDVPSKLFTYYGKYNIVLRKDGYEPLTVKQDVPSPWYEIFPLDFFAENLVPYHIRDERIFTSAMQPPQIVPREVLLQNAEAQRTRARGIGNPPSPVVGPVPLQPSQPTPPVMLTPPQP